MRTGQYKLWTLAALGASLLPAQVRAASQEFPAQEIVEVVVRVESANVTVQAVAGDKLRLEAERLEGAVRRVEKRLEISDVPEGVGRERVKIGDSLRLTLPPQVELKVKTSSGDISVSGLQARVQVSTASGDMSISGCIGPVGVAGVSGDLRLDGVRQDLSINTVSGDVHGADISSPLLEVQSVSGDIALTEVSAQRLRLRTVNGDAVIKGPLPEQASLAVTSVNGNVELWLPKERGFELSFASVSGKLSGDFAAGPGERQDNQAQLRVGSGGIQLKVGTVRGDLTLRKLP